MYKKIKSFFLILLIVVAGGRNVYAANKFDRDCFNRNDIIYYDAGSEKCMPGGG